MNLIFDFIKNNLVNDFKLFISNKKIGRNGRNNIQDNIHLYLKKKKYIIEKVNLLNTDKLLKILPLEITKDPRFVEKLYVSAIINELYTKYKILTYAGFNKDIKLFISPPLVIENSDIDYFVDAFENILDKQPLILIINFVKNYLLRIFNKD